MIHAEGLFVTLGGRSVLSGVDLDVAPGESVALVGPNGAGKTTLLRCVLGLVRYRGALRIGGVDPARRPVDAHRLIGYMPQLPAFCDDTARGALAFVAGLRGSRDETEIDALLDRVGLAAHAQREVASFSAGMRQRLSLAAALVGAPRLLVLDEPTASLDARGQAEVVELLRGLEAEGTTLLMSSHRVEEVRALACRVVTLVDGRVVSDDVHAHAAPQHDDAQPSHGTLHAHVDARPKLRVVR
ncbi:MAG TPA: ABC transporter ATP-binding protein [Minicystis sp.]|nr:ABC transporter ATP-binding protein [Minicystis sp.]